MTLLSITIPTYNRPEKLLAVIKELISQYQNEVEIVVLDNASDIIIEDYIKEHIRDLPEKLKFHRNIANVGAGANVCRCYEIASGEWVWTLADDDEIMTDAVSKILKEIRQIRSKTLVMGINFSTSIHTYHENRILENLAEFWATNSNPKAFSNALFLSSCVFRVRTCRKFLSIAYQRIFTNAPQVAIPLAALNEGHQLLLASAFIVQLIPCPPEEGWNWVSVFSGIPILAEFPNDHTTIRGLAPVLAYFAPGLTIKSGLPFIFLDQQRGRGFWYIYYSRLVPCTRGKHLIIAIIFRFLAGLRYRFPVFQKIGAAVLALAGVKPPETLTGQNRL